MKNVLIGAAALVIGLLIGSVIPSSKIRGLEQEIEELESRQQRSRAEDIAMFLRQGQLSRAEEPLVLDERPEPLEDGVLDEAEDPGEMRRRERRGEVQDWEDFPEDGGLDAVREAMQLRRTQAREALRQQAGAKEEQLDSVDAAVDGMNTQLQDLADRVFADIVEYGEPDRRQMLEFSSEALDIVIATDDAIRGSFEEDQLWDVEDPALDPFSYVDPTILDAFADRGE